MAKPPYQADYLRLTRSLRAARLGLGMDQKTLAARLGVSQTFVSNYERGVKTLNVIEFVAVCVALRLDAGEQVSIVQRRRALRGTRVGSGSEA